jgi:ABC-type glycerol-3-phosphate transport system substrate-binding protein
MMGYNTKHFDHEAHYASKSTRELEALLKQAEQFLKKHPKFEFSRYNEYRQKLKLLIAERIGKK